MKIFLQGLLLIVLFFLSWYGLSRINWTKIFRVEAIADRTEKELGDMLWKSFKSGNEEVDDPYVMNIMDSILNRVCEKNDLDKKRFKLHLVKHEMVNAFALPDDHLVIFTGLLEAADSPEELTGVICHEIAHLQRNHVMKKLVKEIGLSAVINASAGGGEILREAAGVLTSTAFDRKLEKEADITAVEYLINAQIDPEPFANFLYKLSKKDSEMSRYMSWISTHPQSKERANYVMDQVKKRTVYYTPVLSEASWLILQQARAFDSYLLEETE